MRREKLGGLRDRISRQGPPACMLFLQHAWGEQTGYTTAILCTEYKACARYRGADRASTQPSAASPAAVAYAS